MKCSARNTRLSCIPTHCSTFRMSNAKISRLGTHECQGHDNSNTGDYDSEVVGNGWNGTYVVKSPLCSVYNDSLSII